MFQLDLSINGIFDVATNPNAEILGTSISEDADTARPFALSAELDYTTGILIITTSETIDSTPGSQVDRTKLFLSVSPTTNDIALTGSDVLSTIDFTETTIRLTELQHSTGVSGGLSFASGTTSNGASGTVSISTGAATHGRGGDIALSVGASKTNFGGDIVVEAGDSEPQRPVPSQLVNRCTCFYRF